MRPGDMRPETANPTINENSPQQLAREFATEFARELRGYPGSVEMQGQQRAYQLVKARLIAQVLQSVRANHALQPRPSLNNQERFVCFVVGLGLVFALPMVGHALAGAAGRVGSGYVERKFARKLGGYDDESR